jgi:hypothetical protein
VLHDQLFKELLQAFLPEFMMLFFADAAEEIDWSTVEFMDKELFTDSFDGLRRTLDVVARVHTRTGEPEMILIHVEVESSPGPEFPARMYDYYSTLRLRRRVPVFPIVLYVRHGVQAPLSFHEESLFGRRIVRFDFHPVALPAVLGRDLPVQNPVTHALRPLLPDRQPDPVDLVLECYAGIAATAGNPHREALLAHFVDSYAPLTEKQAAALQAKLADNDYQEVRVMMTTWERRGQDLGIRKAILRVLQARFGPISGELEEAVQSASDAGLLDALVDTAATSPTADGFLNTLRSLQSGAEPSK